MPGNKCRTEERKRAKGEWNRHGKKGPDFGGTPKEKKVDFHFPFFPDAVLRSEISVFMNPATSFLPFDGVVATIGKEENKEEILWEGFFAHGIRR